MDNQYLSQRTKSYHNPLHLGVFGETSIRYLQGRLGAENKGQAGFRSTNDGTANAFMNVWFMLSLTKESYLILIKENERQRRNYNVSVYRQDQEHNQLSYPFKLNEADNFYNSVVAGSTSDLYNIIDDQSELKDKNRTSLYPLPPGNYVINISTQRWDMFRYGVYLIIEAPFQTGYLELETEEGDPESYLAQENSVVTSPAFFLLEDTVAGRLPSVREATSHSERTLRAAWTQYTTKKSFPQELVSYLALSS
jgi:hypothetical protein